MNAVNIIGKGESLKFLKQEDILPGYTVGICEATRRIKCDIGFQGDKRSGIKIHEDNVNMIWTMFKNDLYEDYMQVHMNNDTIEKHPHSVVAIIYLMKKKGYRKFNLYCMDATTHGINEYPPYPIVHYSIERYGLKERYSKQRNRIFDVLEDCEYTFITPEPTTDIMIPTTGNPKEFNRVFNQVKPKLSKKERIVPVICSLEDIEGTDIDTKPIILPKEGCTKALHEAVCSHSTADWIIYLNDDISFATPDWLSMLKKNRREYPNIKLFSMNDIKNGISRSQGRRAAFAMMNRNFYIANYCEGNPYIHYAWDDEVKEIAERTGEFMYCENIKINHFLDLSKRDRELQKKDKAVLERRRKLFNKHKEK